VREKPRYQLLAKKGPADLLIREALAVGKSENISVSSITFKRLTSGDRVGNSLNSSTRFIGKQLSCHWRRRDTRF
jgi:hypothetical protein